VSRTTATGTLAEPRSAPFAAAHIVGVALYLAAVGLGTGLKVVTGEIGGGGTLGWVFELTTVVLWLAVLLASMRRQPEGPLWYLVLAYTAVAALLGRLWLIDPLLSSLATLLWNLGFVLYVHLLVAFPSGHLRSPFDRAVVGSAYLANLIIGLLAGLTWTTRCDDRTCIANVIALSPDDRVIGVAATANHWVTVVICALVVVSVVRHWREATPVGRRPLSPIVLTAPLGMAYLAVFHASVALEVEPSQALVLVGNVIFTLLPLGWLLGVLRLRLGRTRLAEFLVALGRGVPVGGLRDLLARTLGDPTLELAFLAPDGDGYVATDGRRVEVPLAPGRTVTRLEGETGTLAILIHDPAIEAEDPGLVEAAANAARLSLENERLAAEVRAQLEEVKASRSRILEATDEERRRLERDLHDGAQQRLVALAMRLQLARAVDPAASAILDEATTELEAAIGEVRDLAHGLHPTILTEAGLGPAIEALAERMPIPVAVYVPERRYPRTVETTGYFVVAESLTNVARHAKANAVTIRAADDGQVLTLSIQDDGRGGAGATTGTGLRGLADRVAAAGGRLTITSPVGAGTELLLELPLR
jgi:signal transduction histidine kinase